MLFQGYRIRRWKSLLGFYQKKAETIEKILKEKSLLYSQHVIYAARLVRYQGEVGRYKGLLASTDESFDEQIQKILKSEKK
jgi:hypothetical protein